MFIDVVMQYLSISAARGDETSQHYLSLLKEAERFRVDNIADYVHERFLPEVDGAMDFDVSNEIPNIAPLADTMWFEMHGDLWNRESQHRLGCLFKVIYDAKEDERKKTVPENARWIVFTTTFAFKGHVVFLAKTCHCLVVDFDGKLLEMQALINPFLSEREYRELQHDVKQTNMSSCLLTALFAMCFCHCKNITVEEEKVSRQVHHATERAKEPVFTFKTINIHPVKKVMTEEGHVESQGLRRALHICRAHFAHYTQEHPLFGKYTGTFYKPMHVRGSPKKGIVMKDYTVHER
jgi:hypothetical protein